jgi:hypothetical protein
MHEMNTTVPVFFALTVITTLAGMQLTVQNVFAASSASAAGGGAAAAASSGEP